MTFNVQMLPLAAMLLQGQSNDSKVRARAVANAILSIPKAERPDVIAFNEVFSEDGREVLLSRLIGNWPHVVKKLDGGGLDEDSGLMLFSRIPFRTLPNGDEHYEHFYTDSEGDDRFATKGVGIVQIGSPFDKTTIAFTHLQASYASEDEYRDTRARQMDAIFSAIEDVLGGDSGLRRGVIILGDLNVRGDSGSVSGEWASVFEQGATSLFGPYVDGWRTYMHPPQRAQEDEGQTSIDYADAGRRQRLDYMCFADRHQMDGVLVPQHMRIRLRNQSDHFSVEAVVQQFTEHCVPSDAIELGSLPMVAGGQPGLPTSIREASLSFQFDGCYQWIFIEQEGTFSIHCSPDVIFELYLQSDLSHPVQPVDILDFRLLDDDLKHVFLERPVDPRGKTFACREPFFVLTRTATGEKGSGLLWITEHMGESDVTAIELRLHQSVSSSFPFGQQLGSEDRCWFKAAMPETYSGAARQERFEISNPSGRVHATILNAAKQPVASTASSSATLIETSGQFQGGERVFVTLERGSINQVGFTITWKSPLSFLDLDEPLYLFVNNESGPDILGSDEPEMQINIDSSSPPVFEGIWDDADTGERWPGLADAIKGKIATTMPGVSTVGFVEGIHIGYIEPDFAAAGWLSVTVPPLSPGESDRVVRTISLPVPDPVSDGLYTFGCTIRRFPR